MTTNVGSRKAENNARCAGWRGISYTVDGDPSKGETHGDTDGTIQQIRIHNRTGANKRCWKN